MTSVTSSQTSTYTRRSPLLLRTGLQPLKGRTYHHSLKRRWTYGRAYFIIAGIALLLAISALGLYIHTAGLKLLGKYE